MRDTHFTILIGVLSLTLHLFSLAVLLWLEWVYNWPLLVPEGLRDLIIWYTPL